jgi:N utilization substance protein A
MKSDFLIALTQLAAERNLPREIVLSAIEAALVSAYKKDSITAGQDISVKLDPGTGDVSVYILKTVVDEVTSPQVEITLADARKIKPDTEVGDIISTDNMPHSAGRIAAQTAKQVVMQRLREAERDLIYEEFAEKEGEVFSVTVQRVDSKFVTVELGRAEAVLPATEQIPSERYRVSNKMKVLLQSVSRSSKGPEIIVSRADRLLMRRLFEMEVPEIYHGSVEIMAIAREAGSRSKVAVRATQNGIDPVGSCVGLRGVRIQNIVNELQGEKIDVIEWSKDAGVLIANALSPSQVLRVEIDTERETATAVVPERQLSLAIGKEGQNARLAAKLTGWKVDIKSNVEAQAATLIKPPVVEAPEQPEEVELPVELEEALEAAVKQAEPEVEAPAEQEVIAKPAVAEAVEVEAVEQDEEQPTEAPVAEVEVAEVEIAVEDALLAEPEVAAEEEEPPAEIKEEPAPEPVIEIERVPEPALPVLERSTSLRDLPEDVWSIRRRGVQPEPGRIRFAEDIAGLRGGVSSRRTDRDGDARRGQRKTKAGRKRRR